METKICKKCQLEKPITDFSPKRKGLNSKCKECCSQEQISRYKSDPDFYREKAREYRKKNPEKYKITDKKYKDKHPERKLLDGTKYRAKKKGITNTLTMDDIIIPEFCPILGIKLEYSKKTVADNSPSVDRIDVTKGYTPDNIHVISHKANRIKNNFTKEEIVKLLNYLNGTVQGMAKNE